MVVKINQIILATDAEMYNHGDYVIDYGNQLRLLNRNRNHNRNKKK